MLKVIKKSLLLAGLVGYVGAATDKVELWQVPQGNGKAPVFYENASKSSKVVSLFKPKQTLQVIAKQKEWAKVMSLDYSEKMAWVPLAELKLITALEVDLKQEENVYDCQVVVRDPDGNKTSNWHSSYQLRPYTNGTIEKILKLDQDLFQNFIEKSNNIIALMMQQEAVTTVRANDKPDANKDNSTAHGDALPTKDKK